MAAPAKPEPPKAISLTPPLSPIQQAIKERREALKEPAKPLEGEPAKPAEGTPPPPVAEEPAKPEGEEAGKPAEGEEPAKPEAEAEGEKPEAEKPPEGEIPENLIVEIPGRRPEDEPLKVAVDDEETADRLRQLKRDAMRREEYHKNMRAVEERADELQVVEQHLTIDPIGFLTDRIKPEIQIELTKHLLSLPEVYTAITDEIESWQDENVRARRIAEMARERSDNRGDTEAQLFRLREVREQGRMVRETIEAITPSDLKEETAVMFHDDCVADMVHYVRDYRAQNRREPARLRPEEVVGILERRLRHYGLTPESALAALSSGQPPRRATAAAPKAPAPGTPDAETARNAGAKLKQAGDDRRAVAAIPGAGAGARPTKIEPPAQQGVKERIAWLKGLVKGK